MKTHYADIVFVKMQVIHLDSNFKQIWGIIMSNESLEMCDEFANLISNEENILGTSVFEILKKYSSTISVFDMMTFSTHIIEENKYVQESYRKDSQKSYIESFLLRVKNISNDKSDYSKSIDKKAFSDAITTLKSTYSNEPPEAKNLLIFQIASIYSTFLLEEPIHPVGTPFPGSLKLEEKNGKFYCPVKDANNDTPNAVCNICLAEQLDF